MDLTGLLISVAGGLFVILIAIIGYFIRNTIESKDSKIEDLVTDYNKLELTVQDFKSQIIILSNDVSDNRKQLMQAISSIKDFIHVNEKIEKQLEKSNILHEDLRSLIKVLVDSPKFGK